MGEVKTPVDFSEVKISPHLFTLADEVNQGQSQGINITSRKTDFQDLP